MRILSAYLFKDAFKPSVVAMFIMLALVWLMQSLRFMDWIVNKGLNVGTFLWITALIIPSLLIVILPLSIFAGSIYSFKRLIDENEIPSLLNAGLSRWKIARPAFFVSLVGVGLTFIISLWAMPAGMTAFKNLQHELRQQGSQLLLEEGTFNQFDDGLTVYVRQRIGANEMRNLLVHDHRDPNKPVTWIADLGKVAFTDEGYPRLILKYGTRQEVSDKRLSVLEFQEHTIDISKPVQAASKRWRGSEERFLTELEDTKQLPEREANRFRSEYHKRLLWPLSPIAFMMIAAVFLVRARTRRRGSFRPMIFAIISGILYQGLLMVANNYALKGSGVGLYGQWGLFIFTVLICSYTLMRQGSR